MSFTKEEIEAELIRRGLPLKRPVQASKSNYDILREKLRSQGKELPELNPFMAGVTGFNTSVENLTHGALQPLYESGLLGQNVSKQSKLLAEIRKGEQKRAEMAHPTATEIGNITGDIAAKLPLYYGTGGGGGLLSSMFAGGLAGGLGGAARYVDEGESRLQNALLEGGMGAGLGAIPPVGKSIGKTLKLPYDIYKASNPEKIAKKIAITDKKTVMENFSKRYSNIYKQAKEAGIKEIEIPKMNTKNLPKKERISIEKFKEKNSFKRAHEADKSLGKTIRKLESYEKSRGLFPEEQKTLIAAKNARGRIQKNIDKAFEAKGANKTAHEYKKIKKDYEKEALPYKNKAITKYLKGELTAEDFVKKLHGQELFRSQLAKKYPEVSLNQALPKVTNIIKNVLPYGPGIGTLGLLGHYLYNQGASK